MTNGSPVLLPLRLWILVELALALGAAASVAFDPAGAAASFAWAITPAASAALIGALYLTLAPAMILGLFARTWEEVRVLILPISAFSTLLLIATLLHWKMFAASSLTFQLWFASHLLPPPIFLALYAIQEPRAVAAKVGLPFPRPLRWAMVLTGALLVLEFGTHFASPDRLASDMPWQVTPLVIRIVSAFILSFALMLLTAAWENDTQRARLVGPGLALALPVVALQLARVSPNIDWTHWRIFAGADLVMLFSVFGLALTALGWRRPGILRTA
jgi:hypothetical protein